MSSSNPTSPTRRKSSTVGSSGSSERRRSSRLSTKSKDQEPVTEADPPQVANGASSDLDKTVDTATDQDDLSSPPTSSGEDEDGANDGQGARPVRLADRFNPWVMGEILTTKTLGEKEDIIGPLPDLSDQPQARYSDGQTVPPLLEDRGIKFTAGNRILQTPGGKRVDQQDHMILKLVDMRPKSKEDRTPRRQLVTYYNSNGIPKDWSHEYTIKKLNDMHRDNIRVICHEFVWSQREADCIAEKFKAKPSISIKELAYHFNNDLIGDYHYRESHEWDELHEGRSVEAIRAEYLRNKEFYDEGEAPTKSEIRDKKWRLANGKTEAQQTWFHHPEEIAKRKAKAKADREAQAKKDAKKKSGSKEITRPTIKSVDDYKKHTIAELKLLAEETKPRGFLKGLKTKGDIVAKFEQDHTDDDEESDGNDGGDDGDGGNDGHDGHGGRDGHDEHDGHGGHDGHDSDDGDDGDDDDEDDDGNAPYVNPFANDSILQKDLPQTKDGTPNYKKLKAADQKQLIADRNMTLSPSESATSDARAKALTAYDERARKQYDAREKKKNNGSMQELYNSKKRKAGNSTGSVAKKAKVAETENEKIPPPSSSKRNSVTKTKPSSRKASIKDQSQVNGTSGGNTATSEEEDEGDDESGLSEE